MDSPADSPADVKPDSPLACDPVINEVMVAGSSSPADEFVELYNPCSQSIDLTGWKLVYRSAAGSSDVSLQDLSAFTLPGYGYLIFAGQGYTGSNPASGTFGGSTGSLSGTAGGVAIKNGTTIVDSIGYGASVSNGFVEGSAATLSAAGKSMARTPNGQDTDNNSADFVEATPTPGAAN